MPSDRADHRHILSTATCLNHRRALATDLKRCGCGIDLMIKKVANQALVDLLGKIAEPKKGRALPRKAGAFDRPLNGEGKGADERGNRMRVGILGSGLMGGKLGTLFARAGHEVVFSDARSTENRFERFGE